MARIETQVSTLVPGATPQQVFAYATDLNTASEFFTGYGPVPAIRRMEMLDAPAPAVGARRRVDLADGSSLVEEILEWDPPHAHVYRVTGYHAPFSWLTRQGQGTWTFAQKSEGTRVTWHYGYELTSPLAYPLAAVIIGLWMKGAMRRALKSIADRTW
jgi:hypothetical protein